MVRLQRWSTVLEIDNPKSNLTKERRLVEISDYLQYLSLSKCYYYNIKKSKKCSCLSFLKDNEPAKLAVATSILLWASMEDLTRQLLMIAEIRSATTLLVVSGAKTSHAQIPKFYRLPFFSSGDTNVDHDLSQYVCNHSYAAVYRHGELAFHRLQAHCKADTETKVLNKQEQIVDGKVVEEEMKKMDLEAGLESSDDSDSEGECSTYMKNKYNKLINSNNANNGLDEDDNEKDNHFLDEQKRNNEVIDNINFGSANKDNTEEARRHHQENMIKSHWETTQLGSRKRRAKMHFDEI